MENKIDYKEVVLKCIAIMQPWIATSSPETDKEVLSELLGVLDDPALAKQLGDEIKKPEQN